MTPYTLSLAAIIVSSVTATNHRSLQLIGDGLTPMEQEWAGAEDPITCIATGSDFFDCCPSKSKDHGVCTLLHCVDLDSIELRANCDCAEVGKYIL